ncbi:aldo/keto reductase [Streptomyces nanshensis]|nr:aldo/keto reductase [Streptomyces nanshensis]
MTWTRARELGRLGGELLLLGMGCWAIGGPWTFDGASAGWGDVDDEESVRAVRTAVESGVTLFDTADVYGCGHSERVLGRALAPVRDDVLIATKGGLLFDEESRSGSGADAAPRYLREAVRGSLRRLGTDRVDVYQLHAGADTPQQAEDVVAVFEELVAEGVIRAYGTSIDDPAIVEVFAAGEHCATAQHECNVFGVDDRVLDVCRASGVTSLGRSPLAMGLLTGKYSSPGELAESDVRRVTPHWDYFKPGAMDGWLDRLARVREVLTSEGRSLAQGALAWVWARSGITVPIPGFRTAEQVRENAAALGSGPLGEPQLAQIDKLLGR